MLPLLLPLVLCVIVAVLVLALVAIPARRQGRDVLTTRGEEMVGQMKAGTDAAASRTAGLVAAASAKVRPGSADSN